MTTTLSGLTHIVSQANGWSIRGMEACLGLVEQGARGVLEPVAIGPQAMAMAGERLLEEASDALQEVEVRRMGRQPEGEPPTSLGRPPGTHRRGAVRAAIIKDQHQILIRPGLADLRQKGGEAGAILVAGRLPQPLPQHLPRGRVQRAGDGNTLIDPGSRHAHWHTALLPDLCQVGIGVQVPRIHVNKPTSSSGSYPLFCSSVRTYLAPATASAS